MRDAKSEQQFPKEGWFSGAAYELYVGRWSKLVAREFMDWLAVSQNGRWLDVGCGTGALSQTILDRMAPSAVMGVDFSPAFVDFVRANIRDERAQFEVGDAQALAVGTGVYDAVVSGLMLNFIPQPERAVAEMARAARLDGVVAAYVWDYAGKMQMLRHFWNAAVALNPAANELEQSHRFPICQPEPLTQLFAMAGLRDVIVRAIDIAMGFQDFNDYWLPFLGGQGPAPSYVMSLSETNRVALRERIRAGLPIAVDGSIPLVARAWAVRGIR